MSGRSTPMAVCLVAVVGASVALGYFYPETLTSTDPAPLQQGDVSEQTFVCPVVDSSTGAVTVFSGDADPAAGSIEAAGAQSVALPPAGSAVALTPGDPTGSVTVVAADASAGQTGTVRSYLDPSDEGRGLAVGSCERPRSEWWFVGVSAAPGQIDELLLANPTGSPAVVSVDVFGSTGPVEVLGVGGVVLQPGEQTSIRVDSLIPGQAIASLRVGTSGGLVTAAVQATAIDGLIPQGAEFLPPAAAPADTLVVPGLLGGPGTRELVVTGGSQDAAVEITLLTPIGPFEHDGGALIPVPAGTTVSVDLTEDIGDGPAAVQVEGSAPVTAAVKSFIPGSLPPGATGVLNRLPVADVAWTAAQQEITGRWLLPLTGVAEAPGGVLLSAVDEPVQAELTIRTANGATVRQSVSVPPWGLTDVPIPITAGAATLVEIGVVDEGRLNAASYQMGALPEGPLAAAANGLDPSGQVLLPLAYPDPQVLGGG